jgi:hypothetical protein
MVFNTNIEEKEMTRPTEITTTQLFSRAGMGFLYNKRAELDPGQAKILNAIYNNKKKKEIVCKQTVTYKLTHSKTGQLGYGRYYSHIGGLETVEKEARGTLCREYYHDIDIVNCHPVILEQFIKNRYNKTFESLEYYNRHRDEVLAKISDNRDEAKTVMLCILYGGKNTIPYLQCFSDSMRDFTQFLINTGDYSDLWNLVKNDEPYFIDSRKKIKVNKYGSFLSLVLQTEEASCMLAMKESLEKDGWSVDVLCYDGVMIRKREGIDFVPSLRNAEDAIEKATGYRVSLLDKEMLYFEVPKADEEVVKGISLEAYTTMKTEFERTHFYHIPTDQIAELNDRGEVFFMKKPHAYNYLTPKWLFKHSEKLGDYTPFLDIWLTDDKRQMIDKIDFAPTDDPSTFVIPLQFAYEKITVADTEALPVFMDVLNILAKGKSLEYTLDYLAHLVQKPLENPKVAIVLTGLKGCGKDTLFDFIMEYVVGSLYSKNYESNEQFFDKHDIGRLNKFLIKLEEADPVICRRNASNLKARITAKYSSFNPKGLNPFEAANYGRNIYTTNTGNPFEMSGGERRFFILNADSTRKSDYDFWTNVRSKLFTPEAGRAVAEMLLARDITNWKPFDMPISEYQKAVVETEKTSEQSFIDEWDGEFLSSSELFNQYKIHCVENSLPYAQNVLSFGKRLLSLIRDGIIYKKKTTDYNGYSKTP